MPKPRSDVPLGEVMATIEQLSFKRSYGQTALESLAAVLEELAAAGTPVAAAKITILATKAREAAARVSVPA